MTDAAEVSGPYARGMDVRHRVIARREVVVDAALGAAVMLVVGAAIVADLGHGRRPDLIAYLFAIGLGLLMLLRRSYPGLALIATAAGLVGYYIAGYPPVGLALPVAAALYSAAERRRLRLAIAVAVVLIVIDYVYRVAVGQSIAFLFGYELATTIALMATAIALGDAARARHLLRAEAEGRQRDTAVQRELEAVARVEAERLRIARDVHDVLAHTVVVVSLQADVAAEAMADDPVAARQALATIRTSAREANRQLRATVGLLKRPGDEDPRGPTGGLWDLDRLLRATTSSGPRVEKHVEGDPAPLPVDVDTTAYRIIQESLANALRHARADLVTIALRYRADQLEIEITDDGCGAPAEGPVDGRRGGLAGMRERVALLGGTLIAGNGAGGGFGVRASLPLPAPR